MAKQKVTLHASNMAHKPDGAEVPMKVLLGGEWVLVSTGTYDAKNKLIHVEVDAEQDAGRAFLEGLTNRNLVRTV